MSKRKLKRQMVRELGIEKFSDIVKRKLKTKNGINTNSRVTYGSKEME
jgi:hypothetical protein